MLDKKFIKEYARFVKNWKKISIVPIDYINKINYSQDVDILPAEIETFYVVQVFLHVVDYAGPPIASLKFETEQGVQSWPIEFFNEKSPSLINLITNYLNYDQVNATAGIMYLTVIGYKVMKN